MKTALQEMVFPLSWEQGASTEGLQRQRIQQLGQLSLAMSKVEFAERMEEHRRFLQEGGAGGSWQTLQVEGLVVAIYQKDNQSEARQFSLEYGRLASGINFTGLTLPFINCCAAYLPALNARAACLPFSLFTDAFLENANFENAQLPGIDFSRADLRGANFRGADLSNVDFENCDLAGADFRGARIVGARFPGANLSGVTT